MQSRGRLERDKGHTTKPSRPLHQEDGLRACRSFARGSSEQAQIDPPTATTLGSLATRSIAWSGELDGGPPRSRGSPTCCTGNSRRMRMAEGFWRIMAGDRFDVTIAGSVVAGHMLSGFFCAVTQNDNRDQLELWSRPWHHRSERSAKWAPAPVKHACSNQRVLIDYVLPSAAILDSVKSNSRSIRRSTSSFMRPSSRRRIAVSRSTRSASSVSTICLA